MMIMLICHANLASQPDHEPVRLAILEGYRILYSKLMGYWCLANKVELGFNTEVLDHFTFLRNHSASQINNTTVSVQFERSVRRVRLTQLRKHYAYIIR